MLEPGILRGLHNIAKMGVLSCPVPKLSASQSNSQFAAGTFESVAPGHTTPARGRKKRCYKSFPDGEVHPATSASADSTPPPTPCSTTGPSTGLPAWGSLHLRVEQAPPSSSCPKLQPLRNEKLLILSRCQTAGPRWINFRTQGFYKTEGTWLLQCLLFFVCFYADAGGNIPSAQESKTSLK